MTKLQELIHRIWSSNNRSALDDAIEEAKRVERRLEACQNERRIHEDETNTALLRYEENLEYAESTIKKLKLDNHGLETELKSQKQYYLYLRRKKDELARNDT